jgi:hypothetical protein
MATSITTSPAAYGLCKNPGQLKFTIQSNAYITTPGTPASISMGYSGGNNPTDGLTLIISAPILSASVTFTFVAGVPANSLEVAIGATSADTNDNLFAAILTHYELVHNYDWTMPAGSVLATARENGSDYDFTITGTSTIVSAPVAGTDEVVRTDLRIIADIWIMILGAFSLELELSLTPDETGSAEIDVQSVLLGYLEAHLPELNQALSSLASEIHVEYKVQHTDYYSDAYHTYEDSGSYRAILAGYPELLLGTQQFSTEYFTATTDRKFLTRIPRAEGLKIPNDCPAFLYLWCNTTDTYKLGVRMYYTDGTDSYSYNILNRATGSALVCWPVGYDVLDLDTLKTAGKTVRYYEVFVILGADIATATNTTEFFKIVPDFQFYEKKHFFFFLNSLGGMDTVFMSGDMELNIETVGEKYQVSERDHTEEYTYGELKSGIKTFTNPNKYFTGYKSKAYVEYLQELIKSEAIYLVAETQHIEMRMDTDSARIYSLNDFQYGLELEMTPAQINRGWAVLSR